jgi:hypothetical protein
MVLRRQGCCDGHSPRSVSVLPGELKALVRRNALKLGHDRFPYRVGTARIRRWAGFLDEPESSKQSRLRTWNVLQRIRLVLSETENVVIPPPAQNTFDAEAEALEHAQTKSFRIRNEAIKSLCSSVRRFRDATIKEECKSDYPHALQAQWKALDRLGLPGGRGRREDSVN